MVGSGNSTCTRDDAAWFSDYFNVKAEGNWEGKNILYQTVAAAEVAKKHRLSLGELNTRLEKIKKKLLDCQVYASSSGSG